MSTEFSNPAGPFAQRLSELRPLLLDGGLATQLEAMGQALHPTLWSAGLLVTAPEAILAVHRAYADAGAEVLISASYQASRAGFATLGIDAEAADELLLASVQLARTAAAERPGTLVAASIGPWGATRHDGSEYTGQYEIEDAALEAFHAERLAVLDQAGADVLACETLPNLREIEIISSLLETTRTPAWVSFCCRDGQSLSNGTPIEVAAQCFRNHPTVLALGVNCTAPRHLPSLVRRLRTAVPDLPVIVYPNSGEAYDADHNTWRGTIEERDAGSAAATWIAAGAKGVGGCCRMGPQHINAMAQAIAKEI